MYLLLNNVKLQIALVHSVYIVKFSNTTNKHIDQVRQVLTLLQEVGVTLSLKKWKFSTICIDYLRHVIRL